MHPSITQFARVAVIASMLAATAAADEVALTPRQGLLLLRNGEALRGRIARVGDQYHVVLADGEIRIRATEVEGFCRDLEDGYEWKRSRLEPGKIQDHLALAEWCLRHGLTGHAAGQLAEAIAIDPSHPKLPLLERRLKLASAEKPAPITPTATAQAQASNDDLDRMVRAMPPGTVETFTTTVQPLLLNNCAAAACHGASTQAQMRLARLPPGRSVSRRLTQRNLYATLKWIDREQPDESRLLQAPIAAHGTSKTAVFSERDASKYRQLYAWVHAVASGQDPQPSSVETPGALLQPAARPKVGNDVDEEPDADDESSEYDDIPSEEEFAEYDAQGEALFGGAAESTSGSDAPDATSTDEPTEGEEIPAAADDFGTDDRLDPSGGDAKTPKSSAKADAKGRAAGRGKPPQRGAKSSRYQPVDPFDAEVFNRRFFPPKAE
jgi:hypothetical protein